MKTVNMFILLLKEKSENARLLTEIWKTTGSEDEDTISEWRGRSAALEYAADLAESFLMESN